MITTWCTNSHAFVSTPAPQHTILSRSAFQVPVKLGLDNRCPWILSLMQALGSIHCVKVRGIPVPEEFLAKGVHGLHDHLFDVALLAAVLGKLRDAAAHDLGLIVHAKLVHDLNQAVLVARPCLLKICVHTAHSGFTNTLPALRLGCRLLSVPQATLAKIEST